MHEAFADRICSGMDRAVREQPFGPGMVVWTIDGYMFAAYTEAGGGLSVRVPKAEVAEDGRQWRTRQATRRPCRARVGC
jgi:hypothetical protein